MVRVRFAPSPTGFLHQGNIRTALFNYLFAKKQGGVLLLRVDDTDRERSKPEFEQAIFEGLAWLGLKYDEGPDVGGDYGPYRQSERTDIYKKYLQQLIDSGHVYADFSSPEDIEAQRRSALATGKTFVFKSKDRGLSKEEVQERLDKGEKPHYRFGVDLEIIKFEDAVYGEKVFDTRTIGDFVVARADGSFLYLFASAIDDSLMQVSHVIRGEDGMSNTPRQILILKALGLKAPQFAHLPLILGEDHTLLSKRNGSTPLADLKGQGYLPQALLNYLSHLGWAPPPGKEILSLEQTVDAFELERVSRSSAIFDWNKFNYINLAYLRDLSDQEYLSLAKQVLKKSELGTPSVPEGQLDQAILTLRPNVKVLKDLPEWVQLLLGEPKFDDEEVIEVLKIPETAKVLAAGIELLGESPEEFNDEIYQTFIEDLKKKSKVKGKKLFMPLRVSITGGTAGPELVNLFSTLGKKKVLERIKSAAENLQHEESK